MTTLNLNRQNDKTIDIQTLFAMREELSQCLEIAPSSPDWEDMIRQILAFQHRDGSFSLVESPHIPSDARVDFYYMPTYLCTAILMKAMLHTPALLEGTDSLARGLMCSCGRNLDGHGYDAMEEQLKALQIFISGGVKEFLEKYPKLCLQFTVMIRRIKREYQRCIEEDRFVFGFGSNYEKEIRAIVSDLS